MQLDKLTKELERSWDPEMGFLGRLRDGYFSHDGCLETLRLLKDIHSEIKRKEPSTLDRNLVRLLWYIPTYLVWQKDFLMERKQIDGQDYDNVCDQFLTALSEILEIQ